MNQQNKTENKENTQTLIRQSSKTNPASQHKKKLPNTGKNTWKQKKYPYTITQYMGSCFKPFNNSSPKGKE